MAGLPISALPPRSTAQLLDTDMFVLAIGTQIGDNRKTTMADLKAFIHLDKFPHLITDSTWHTFNPLDAGKFLRVNLAGTGLEFATTISSLASLTDVVLGVLSIGDVLTYNGISWVNSPGASAVGWLLDGNTVGSLKYIGTDDNFDFPIRVNSVESARFKTDGNYKFSGTFVDLADISSASPYQRKLYNIVGGVNVDWENAFLQVNGVTFLDWGNKRLINAASLIVADWQSKTLLDGAGIALVDWNAAHLNNATGSLSVNWDIRTLNVGVTSVLDWSGSGGNSIVINGYNPGLGSAFVVQGLSETVGASINTVVSGATDTDGFYKQFSVRGSCASGTDYLAIQGLSTFANTASNYGIWGLADNADLANVGVLGEALGDAIAGLNVGVKATAFGGVNINKGLDSEAIGGNQNYAAYLTASGGALNYALYLFLGQANFGSIQTGKVGLVSGDLYFDTAANILANGDLVCGRVV